MQKKKNDAFMTVLSVVIAILIGVAIYAGYKVFVIEKGYKDAKDAYDSVANNYTSVVPIDPTPEVQQQVPTATPKVNNSIAQFKDVDFDRLRSEVNHDIIAWLSCPDTVIDYPVVQGRDNEHYLYYNVNGHESASGAIFLECQNAPDFTDRNNVLHGHHMMSGAMFASLDKWQNQEYYEAHPYFMLNTYNSGDYKLDVVAAFNTDEGSEAYRYTFMGDSDFQGWIDWVTANSRIRSNAVFDTTNRYAVFSTCAYDGGPERRSIVVVVIHEM